MNVFLTGAGGFLGRAIAKAGADEGHEMLAMHRPTSPLSHADRSTRMIPVAGDLRENGAWRDQLARGWVRSPG